MTDDEAERRYNIIAEARETLARTAHIKVERRIHRDDGHLTDWSRGMPPKPAPPTVEEVKQIVRDELAGYQSQIDRVASALAEHKQIADARRDATADFVAQVRKELRAEIAKARGGEEFFYTDEDGVKQDAELHARIINPVDYPIDEEIMQPIRAKHRSRYLAQRNRSRVIDLPNPLGSRRGA